MSASSTSTAPQNFYPRPPRGGRRFVFGLKVTPTLFLSTPSARRATWRSLIQRSMSFNFYPRPPRGGRPSFLKFVSPKIRYFYPRPPRGGRHPAAVKSNDNVRFLSTPSARRATVIAFSYAILQEFLSTPSARRATHASAFLPARMGDFYPRPPRGGRPDRSLSCGVAELFLSTPSARRATRYTRSGLCCPGISIHALREEGDPR